ALLLPPLGSVTPGGGVTVAVFTRLPVAEGLTRTVKVKVTLAPTGRSTVADRAPVPLPLAGSVTVPPPLLAVAFQVAEVAPAGRGSDTLAPLTALGPLLLTVMV